MDDILTIEREGAIAILTLNRPAVLNALNAELLMRLEQTLDTFKSDAALRAVVITGAGERAFAAGADIAELAALNGAAAGEAKARAGQHVTELIEALPVPVIGAVNGFALGGGCELAMQCDLIIAADTAKFGQPEIKLGIIPGAGGTQRLPRAVGKAKAMDMVLTGRMLDAAEAERAGLVSRVVPFAELMNVALAAADTVNELSGASVMMAKESVNRAFEGTLADGIMFERRLFQALFATEDQKEGMDAFLNKRKPAFRQR